MALPMRGAYRVRPRERQAGDLVARAGYGDTWDYGRGFVTDVGRGVVDRDSEERANPRMPV